MTTHVTINYWEFGSKFARLTVSAPYSAKTASSVNVTFRSRLKLLHLHSILPKDITTIKMRLLFSLAIQSAILWNLASGSSVPGQLFLNDASRKSSHSSAIDTSTARSMLAHILGLSQFYTLNPSNKEEIEEVNKFDSPNLEIFGESQNNGGRALVIIEGVSSPEGRHITPSCPDV